MRSYWIIAVTLAISASMATGLWSYPVAQGQTNKQKQKSSITEDMPCQACHSTDSWKQPGQTQSDASSSGFDHAKTGFPLTGQHERTACTECHRPGLKVTRQCVSCHQDSHQGRLGKFCDSCHSARGWDEVRAIDLHRQTRLPLTGMHVLADCTQCHRRTGERQWSGVPSDCFSCHEAEYRSPTTSPLHQGNASTTPFPRDCALCHRSFGWTPARPDLSVVRGATAGLNIPSGHDIRFAISYGPHRTVDCQSCHVAPNNPSAVQCVGCHAHNIVKLQRTHKTQLTSLHASACLSCHPAGTSR